MKKFITQVIIIALLAYMLELFFPWWSIAIAAAMGGLFLRSEANFWAGFCGIGLLWLSVALVIDITSSSLAGKVAAIMHLNESILILVTTLIGALVGGLASFTGSLVTRRKTEDGSVPSRAIMKDDSQ